uniref:Uncharacterized protein n=1 Tax=Sus scrofa TaxID=9823 RepID=A0A8D1SWN1_PIG
QRRLRFGPVARVTLMAESEPVLGLLPLLRSAFGSPFDPATLSEEESRLLLAAMVNDYEQMKAREMQKQRAQGSG